MTYIQENVLDQIADTIAMRRPELGGALLGPRGQEIVSHFLFDEQANVTVASYSPSRNLAKQIQQIEAQSDLEWKGIVHSHPGDLDRPSGGDVYEIGANFRLNSHMDVFLCPIVSFQNLDYLAPHEVRCGKGKISLYRAVRSRSRSAHCAIEPFINTEEAVISGGRASFLDELAKVRQHVRLAAEYLRAQSYEILTANFSGSDTITARIQLHGVELLLLISRSSYPMVAPVVLVTPTTQGISEGISEETSRDTIQINPVWWDLGLSEEQRMIDSLSRWIDQPVYRSTVQGTEKKTKEVNTPSPAPFRIAYGPCGGSALTFDAEKAKLAGWDVLVTQRDAEAEAHAIHMALFARSNGILAQELKDAHVLIAGLGSGGSYIARELVRAGVGSLTLIDSETVEPANLSRTEYSLGDVAKLKTEALARRLLQINPALNVRLYSQNVQDLDTQTIGQLVTEANLVVAATDDKKAQLALGHFAYYLNRPAVFGGMYAGARGGEVIFTVPEETACFLCATKKRQAMEERVGEVSRQTDYGTGKLKGEMALAVDIQHVTSVVVKVCLSLLLKGISSNLNLATFLDTQIADQANYITFSTVSDYWFYPQIFGNTPGQYAYQSVWLGVTKSEDCPICGRVENRSDPHNSILKTPSLGILQQLQDMILEDTILEDTTSEDTISEEDPGSDDVPHMGEDPGSEVDPEIVQTNI